MSRCAELLIPGLIEMCDYESIFGRLALKLCNHSHVVGAFGGGTSLRAGRSRVRFPMVSLEFLIDIILPAALWSWSRLNL